MMIADALISSQREARMQSPSLASLALLAFVLAAVVGAFLPGKSHTDRAPRAYLPQLMSQAR